MYLENFALLTLDARAGDSAEPLYESVGDHIAGIIPKFVKDPHIDTLNGPNYICKQL